MNHKVKISINQNECIGCSFCISCLPKIFKYDEENFKGKLKEKEKLTETITVELTEEELKQVKEAVKGCPAQAISITEV